MGHTAFFRQFRHLFTKALRIASQDHIKNQENSLPSSGWTRRRFSSALATSAALSALPHLALASQQPRIAIIGGGMAGLSAAYWLKEHYGLTAQVYEARKRLGGRMLSATGMFAEGVTTDLGGAFINTDHADMRYFTDRFDLRLLPIKKIAETLPYPSDTFFYEGVKRSETDIATDLAPLAAQIATDAAKLNTAYALFAPRFDRLSIADYLDQHAHLIPQPYIRSLMTSVIRSEYGVEPEESSALELLFILPSIDDDQVDLLSASDEALMVEGGSSQIIHALAAYLGEHVYTHWPLRRLEALEPGYRLTFLHGQIVEADYVIIALPFPVLRKLELAITLPRTLQQFIQQARLGHNEKVQAGFADRVWYSDAGFTSNLWNDRDYCVAWDATARTPMRPDGVLTFFFGGNQVAAITGQGAATLGNNLVSHLDQAVPGADAAKTEEYLRTYWTRNPFTQGSYSSYAPGQLTQFADWFYIDSNRPSQRQDVIVDNLAFAGEHLSDAFYGYMNGAAETGRLAARAIAERIIG